MAWEKVRWKKDKGKKGKEDGKGGRRRRRRNRRTAGGTFSPNLVLLASSIVLALFVVERARSNSVTRLQTKHLRNFGKCGILATKSEFASELHFARHWRDLKPPRSLLVSPTLTHTIKISGRRIFHVSGHCLPGIFQFCFVALPHFSLASFEWNASEKSRWRAKCKILKYECGLESKICI